MCAWLLVSQVGVPSEAAVTELSAAVCESWAATAQQLTRLGAEVVPVRLPHTAPALAAYYILVSAEASSNLARYDGVRYGERRAAQAEEAEEAKAAASLHEAYARSRSAAFGQEVQRRLLVRCCLPPRLFVPCCCLRLTCAVRRRSVRAPVLSCIWTTHSARGGAGGRECVQMGTYALSSELVSVSFQKAQKARDADGMMPASLNSYILLIRGFSPQHRFARRSEDARAPRLD